MTKTTREAIAAWGSKSERLNEMERQYLAGNLIPIEEVNHDRNPH